MNSLSHESFHSKTLCRSSRRVTAILCLLRAAASLFLHPPPLAAASDTPTVFRQDRLVIGYWVGPQDPNRAEERYREIAEANFTLAMGVRPADVAACSRVGLKVILETGTESNVVLDHSACWGVLLTDEPGAHQFPELARQTENIRRTHPGKFGYINLFPNYASAAQLGTSSYEEHIRKFVAEVKPEVLSMDHYPAMRPDRDTRDDYCANLETLRVEALKAGIPFWNYFYSMPFNDRIDPTEAQIRWQIFTSLAYGAKGVLYFCYWTPGKGNGGTGEFPKGGAILTAEGEKTRHYNEARRINAGLKLWSPVLMDLTSTGVRRIKGGKTSEEILSGSPLQRVARVGSDPEPELIVGTFRHRDGRRAVLVVNHHTGFTAWPTLTFDVPSGSVQEVDSHTGAIHPVVDDSPELPGLQISFGPGDGRLFLVPPTSKLP